MSEEVLVALGDLTNGALNYYKATKTVMVRKRVIEDYINQLQQENQKLKKQLEHCKEKEIERINKDLLQAKNDYLERHVKSIVNMIGGNNE